MTPQQVAPSDTTVWLHMSGFLGAVPKDHDLQRPNSQNNPEFSQHDVCMWKNELRQHWKQPTKEIPQIHGTRGLFRTQHSYASMDTSRTETTHRGSEDTAVGPYLERGHTRTNKELSRLSSTTRITHGPGCEQTSLQGRGYVECCWPLRRRGWNQDTTTPTETALLHGTETQKLTHEGEDVEKRAPCMAGRSEMGQPLWEVGWILKC